MTTPRRNRASERRDADHQFVPSAGRSTPKHCQVCGYDGHVRFPGTDHEEWHHGSLSQVVIPHPDATILFNSGTKRHYPSDRYEGATLCGRTWAGRGRVWRLSDGIRGTVCVDCIQELSKISGRNIPRPPAWFA